MTHIPTVETPGSGTVSLGLL
jgi:hypothetical protein